MRPPRSSAAGDGRRTDQRRVVVTGMGAVTAAGGGVEAFWRACVEGRPALRPLRRFDASTFGPVAAGEVEGIEGPSKASDFALAAAAEAIRAAGLEDGRLPRGSGTVIGTCLGDAIDDGSVAPRADGLAAPALRLAARYELTGPVSTVSVACASGSAAIAHAAGCIRRGEADLLLAGGADALSRFVVAGFWLLRALSPGCVRPFDRRRDGLALGEGAGLLVLESESAARRRGAPIVAEILGGGSAADAYHMTGPAPDGEGARRAMAAALQDAGRAPEDVQFISAHGTGTSFNDRMETAAIKRLLGERARQVPIDSIKPIIGHTLGAAGALEAILCARVLGEGIVPPTVNLEEPDAECDLDYVPRAAREHEVRCALSTSSGFAGQNAAIVMGAP